MMSVFTSIGICFMTQIMVCLGKCFMCIWKESVYSAIVGSGVLKVLLRFSWLVMLCKLSIPLLIFYLINYYERNVDIYHYNCGFFSPLSSICFYVFWSSCIRRVYTFIIISSWWTDTFIFMKCSFFITANVSYSEIQFV